jgi:hypothetical protein
MLFSSGRTHRSSLSTHYFLKEAMMMMRRRTSLFSGIGMILLAASLVVTAQDPATTPNSEQEKAQAALREKALQLFDQVVADVQTLKLPENRLRVQWEMGDLIWDYDEARARTLFSQALAGINELIRNLDVNDRRFRELLQVPTQLRQECLTTISRRDPKLAYESFLGMRLPVAPPPANAPPNMPPNQNANQQNSETNLEMSLLAAMAASDPRLALQNAEASLDKGQFPNSLARLLAQLQQKDKDAAARLKEKIFKKLNTSTLLSNQGASTLALSLLRPGPRLSGTQTAAVSTGNSNNSNNQALDEAAYRELLDLVVAAALSTGPINMQPPRPVGPGAQRDEGQMQIAQNNANARTLVSGLSPLQAQIDKYLPGRSAAIRQKFSEMGIRGNPITIDAEISALMRQGTTDSFLQAAARSTGETQKMLYQQAAHRAISEGNPDRASQIASSYLDPRQRESITQEIDRQKTMQNALVGKMEDARQLLAGMRTDNERINWLTQIASMAVKKNEPKLALPFLEEARNMVNRRAENYQQLELQMRVAHAFAPVEAARSFEVLALGVEQLNELVSAAAVLSGFELPVFKEGEMRLQGGGQLSNMVSRFGQELANLARSDFERAQNSADRFHRFEARLLARLSIVRTLLNKRTNNNDAPPPPLPPPPR